MIHQHDLGGALLELKKYRRILIDHDLQMRGEVNDGSGRVSIEGQGNICDLLCQEDQDKLRRTVENLKNNDVASLTLTTLAESHCEIIVVRNDQDYELIYCDLSESLQFIEKLATFYRYFRSTPIAIAMTDSEGQILEVNPSFLTLYGYELKDVLGENPRILKSGRHFPQLYESMWQQIADPQVGHWSGEVVNRASDGGEVTVMLSISAVRHANGTLQGYIASAFNISQQKRLEQQLKNYNNELKDLNALKSELTAITSHDLKAPINAIISRVNLVKASLDTMTTEQISAHLDKMVSAGQKMGEFINQLLDMERIEAGRVQFETERLNLDAVLYSTVELNRLTAADKQVDIHYQQEGTFLPIRADRMKLEQVFNNILSNAINYSPSGSSIRVSCRKLDDAIQIEMTDQGPGIPAEEIAGIFDRFSQVKKKGALSIRAHGSGLGLNIVQKYVEMHNGTVAVRNGEDKGCTFTVTIQGRGQITSSADLAALVVDSRDQICPYLETALKNRDVCCYVCKTPQEMQRILDNEQPELVFFLDSNPQSTSADDGAPSLKVILNNVCLSADSGQYYQSLQMPVLDVEIYNLLTDVIRHINRTDA
ncbi:PAS domain S-box-containing protein [Desulfuromusa kysingii]|uniref:histidine kinase n=1 Tax=Desulfuromusa kysingii TaxID=37625 RepID=A0A1H4C9P0_9BACT|nr:PAS domain-containing sensor histidine kinase [Desulfuromusa kysingii]SEA57094.1 PAS domain S-box-containing protein [Desulfuromusa kysingii]